MRIKAFDVLLYSDNTYRVVNPGSILIGKDTESFISHYAPDILLVLRPTKQQREIIKLAILN